MSDTFYIGQPDYLEKLNDVANAAFIVNYDDIGAAWSNGLAEIQLSSALTIPRVVKFDCTISSLTVIGLGVGEGVGSCQIDIRKASYSAYPTTASITAENYPTITSGRKFRTSTFTGWTSLNLSRGDIVEFDLLSTSGFSSVFVFMEIRPR